MKRLLSVCIPRAVCSVAGGLLLIAVNAGAGEKLQLARFDVDATPPVGSMMAYDPVQRVGELSLRCRGIALLGAAEPVVLCAVDWIGIGNEAHDVFRQMLATAAQTTPQRVAVHAVHQHDAPGCDFTAERLLKDAGVKELGRYDGRFTRMVMELSLIHI
ncbi:MAG: hypothetical protein N3B01_10605, partial [Verrucomicrobiae bacterium]|nr:hypothetical protein [Verrucomicrobiae bacterium]